MKTTRDQIKDRHSVLFRMMVVGFTLGAFLGCCVTAYLNERPFWVILGQWIGLAVGTVVGILWTYHRDKGATN
jgi:uncharacterized membrane protein YoaK (UPF0700 family)